MLGQKHIIGAGFEGSVSLPPLRPKTRCFHQAKAPLDYYPFGMLLESYANAVWAYGFGFNGMEKDDETDLINFGARFYSVDYGKFLSVDPLAREYTWLSPYHFVANTPTINIEVDGRYFIRNIRPSTSHPSRSKRKDMNWVIMVTDYKQMKELDRLSAIPIVGIIAEIPRLVARAVDPSMSYNAAEWTKFAVNTTLKISGYGIAKGALDLGRFIVAVNREMVGLIFNIVNNPEYAEILIDMEAARRLASKGIGWITYTDDGKKRNAFVRGLEVSELVILEWKEEFQKEAGDKKLSEDEMDNLIKQRIEKLMGDEKNKIKVEVNETIKKAEEQAKKESNE